MGDTLNLLNEHSLDPPIQPPKRGRKPKQKPDTLDQPIDKIPKKRGRKPKGGKIIQTYEITKIPEISTKPHIILHLNCSVDEMLCMFKGPTCLNPDIRAANMDTIKNSSGIISNTSTVMNSSEPPNRSTAYFETPASDNLNERLLALQFNLQNDNLMNTSTSACFWCTCAFTNSPVYIPKFKRNGSYHAYGNFCGPECAVAFLMNEHIGRSTKFERCSLLNHIYGNIYSYCDNIKPAPSPFFLLDKYCGNLTIQQYRELLRKDKLLLVIEHPLTRVIPEIHYDNGEYTNTKLKAPSNESRKITSKTTQPNAFDNIFTPQIN